MGDHTEQAKQHFMQGISRIAHFWGFPKATGAIYAAIYLSQEPVTLDSLVKQVGVSKGAVSTSVRHLLRLMMVHKQIRVGDRKDYYSAETDFWKIVKNILKEREKHEFDLALHTVSESIEMMDSVHPDNIDDSVAFCRKRMKNMKRFFDSLDSLVAMVIALDDLRAGTIAKIFGKSK